ncbi:Nrp1p [Sugiyamaella lignohabitans]|uniref:Nrp1p n=1 Tax=Sugiyamaella lignohabitans TaxID=796027 RepID=A0A161HJM2_9ASCO|nr:Nrp1p [Sugiyamaella lignohabitans]ANB11638.1 Nrp1p [Sugiyamaella lignohabitans]
MCTSLTTLTWDSVKNAPSFREGIMAFDNYLQETLISKGTDFAFVTLNGSDLRVQLAREAHDKGVILPPYLRHPKYFDLRSEYTRWQAHHPESIPYSAASISSIYVALDVMDAKSGNRSVVPSATESRRAIDAAHLSTQILRALIQKSQPSDQHPDVLTRPVDTAADLAAFINENSKVLHLSNLPHDTTQSELESWFTQYGGRPISFWTLRTPDPNRSVEAGFALFSSHEDAMASLSMNGRALNDRAIEISPSSNRVLERAQEILSPFPPSKNRPRPGDWTCPSCGFSNFQRRTACFRCSYPSPTQTSISSGSNVNHNRNNSSQSNIALYSGSSDYQQQVGMAQSLNPTVSSSTNAASASQQTLYQQQQQQTQPQSQQMHLMNHPQHLNHQVASNTMNNVNSTSRNYGVLNNNGATTGPNQIRSLPSGGNLTGIPSVPFRAGDWKCGADGCNYHNFAKNIYCLRCGAPRATAATTGGPVNPQHNRVPSYSKQPQFSANQYTQPLATTDTGYPQLRQASGPLPGVQPGW